MNGIHRTQFDHARLDPLSRVIWSRVFWLSLTWNLRQAEWWSKRVLTSIIVAPLRNLWLLLVVTWMLEIVAVNAIYAIAKRSLKKILDFNGVLNSWPRDLPVRCSTNWAMKPQTLGAGQLWVHMFPGKKRVLMIYEINLWYLYRCKKRGNKFCRRSKV